MGNQSNYDTGPAKAASKTLQVFPVNTTSPKSDTAENGSEIERRAALRKRTLRRVHSASIEFEDQETFENFKMRE